jgi:hypothetical protein
LYPPPPPPGFHNIKPFTFLCVQSSIGVVLVWKLCTSRYYGFAFTGTRSVILDGFYLFIFCVLCFIQIYVVDSLDIERIGDAKHEFQVQFCVCRCFSNILVKISKFLIYCDNY